MKILRALVPVILCLALCLSLTACGEPEPAPTPSPTPTETPSPTPYYKPVTYRLGTGSRTLKAMPKKVVTVGPNCTELFCTLGLTDYVIGKCMSNHSAGPLEEYAEEYKGIPTLCEGYPSLEQLKESGCDFIYASSWAFDYLKLSELEKAGIGVYINDASDMHELWAEVEDMGRIFCVSDVARRFIAGERERITAVGDKLDSAESRRVLVLDSVIGKMVYSSGRGSIESEILKAAGCENVLEGISEAWGAVTAEDVARAEPELIIIHDYKGSDSESTLNAFLALEGMAELDCVKNESFLVYSLENAMPGARCALTVETIAKAAFPELFTEPAEETDDTTEDGDV